MNADAVSDLVLLLACALSGAACGARRPAWRGAMLLLGLAAAAGVLRYGGLVGALGPHRFLSMLAAVVAFVLMLVALRWPTDPLAVRTTAVGRFVVVVGGLGVLLNLTIAPWWSQAVPAAVALALLWTVLQARSGLGLLGCLALLGSFAVALAGSAVDSLGWINRTQALHYLLAVAVVLLGWAGTRRRSNEAV